MFDVKSLVRGPQAPVQSDLPLTAGSLTSIAQPKRPIGRPVGSVQKRPSNMKQELYNILVTQQIGGIGGKDIQSMMPSNVHDIYKNPKANMGKRRVRKYDWVPFTNHARNDGVQLHHWERMDNDKEEPYCFSKWNKCTMKRIESPTIYHPKQRAPLLERSLSSGNHSPVKRAAPRLPTKLTADKFVEAIKTIDTFIFDADGVLWLGDDALPGSARTVDLLLRPKKRVIVLTNNATKSRACYAKKLAKLGFPAALNKDSLVNPAAVVAEVLALSGLKNSGKNVYMIGAQGVRDELDEVGIEYFGLRPEPEEKSDGSAFMFDIDLEFPPEDVGAVVVGYGKHFNYHKLMIAASYPQELDCIFVATNEDETCPGPNSNVITPDAGPLVAAVRVAFRSPWASRTRRRDGRRQNEHGRDVRTGPRPGDPAGALGLPSTRGRDG